MEQQQPPQYMDAVRIEQACDALEKLATTHANRTNAMPQRYHNVLTRAEFAISAHNWDDVRTAIIELICHNDQYTVDEDDRIAARAIVSELLDGDDNIDANAVDRALTHVTTRMETRAVADHFRRAYVEHVSVLTHNVSDAIGHYGRKGEWAREWALDKNRMDEQSPMARLTERMRRAALNHFLYRMADWARPCPNHSLPCALETLCNAIGPQFVRNVLQWAVPLDRANALYHMGPNRTDRNVIGLMWIDSAEFSRRVAEGADNGGQVFATINKRLGWYASIGDGKLLDASTLLATTLPERLVSK